MSTTLKTLNEGFNKRYLTNKKLNEWQSSKQSHFKDPSRLFVKIDLDNLSEEESEFYIQKASQLLTNMLFKTELLEDNSDGTYSIAFPGSQDFEELLAARLDKLHIPYEISEDGTFNISKTNESFNKKYLKEYQDYEDKSDLGTYYDNLEKAAKYYGLYPADNVRGDEGSVFFVDTNDEDRTSVFEVDVHDMDDIVYDLKTVSKLRRWIDDQLPDSVASELRRKTLRSRKSKTKSQHNDEKYVMSRERYNALKAGRVSSADPRRRAFYIPEYESWLSSEQLADIIARVVMKHKDNPEVKKLFDKAQSLGYFESGIKPRFYVPYFLNDCYWYGPQILKHEVNGWLLDHIPQELVEPES